MKFQRIAIVQSIKYKDTSESLCKCLQKNLKRRGFSQNQIYVFKVCEIEDIPRAIHTLARVGKPAPFSSIIAIGVLLVPANCVNTYVPDFINSSIMKIGLDFDVHIKNSILVASSLPNKKRRWGKLIKKTAKSVQASTELMSTLANFVNPT
jgi:6,7-dimethyl-8-ribityllumazine synthase